MPSYPVILTHMNSVALYTEVRNTNKYLCTNVTASTLGKMGKHLYVYLDTRPTGYEQMSPK